MQPIDEKPTVQVPVTRLDEAPTEQLSAAPIDDRPTVRLPSGQPAPAGRVRSLPAILQSHRRVVIVGVSTLVAIVLLVNAPITLPFGPASAITPLSTTTASHTPPGSSPTVAPTATPNLSWAKDWQSLAEQAYVDNIIAHMSLDQEIAQMVMISFNGPTLPSGYADLISQYGVGGAVLYSLTGNVVSGPQMQKLVSSMQSQAPIPLIVATDQEGGEVNRLASIPGYAGQPSAYSIGAGGDPNVAKQWGEQDAQGLHSLGINVDFAPVVDVLNVPFGEGDIQARAFGTTPKVVTEMAGAFLQGLQEGHHVAGTLKHFPGLGDVPTDPHLQLYTLTRSLTNLESIDWVPYRDLIATGQVDVVMSTHVVLAAVDSTEPASESYAVLTGILRDKLGFKGVIVTDGVYMKALWQNCGCTSFAPIFLKLVEAGNDLICSLWDFGSTQLFIQTIHDAVMNGTISKQRIDDSVRRILMLKLQYGILAIPHGGG
jgi:beta-N-acetylhexosaminidase